MEYILMIIVALTIVLVIGNAFRQIVNYLWQVMACEVTAPCPHCPPPEEVKNQLDPSACR